MKNITWVPCTSHDQYIAEAASVLIEQVIRKKDSFLTLAAGQSPLDVYISWVRQTIERSTPTDRLVIHKLDEWAGLPECHHSTCESFLRQHVIHPLHIKDNHYLGVSSEEEDHVREAARMRSELSSRNPVDICVLGLGRNGHLGLNEPNDYLCPYTHVEALTDSSQRHAMLSGHIVKQGITTGIAEILRARHILLLVSGEGKEASLQRLQAAEISTNFPASFLMLHEKVTVIIDEPYSKLFNASMEEPYEKETEYQPAGIKAE